MPTGYTKTMHQDPAGQPTPPPWHIHRLETRIAIKAGKRNTICYMQIGPQENENAALIITAHELLNVAKVLQMLATSPRFQEMKVMSAIAELQNNSAWIEPGPVIAKVEGPQS